MKKMLLVYDIVIFIYSCTPIKYATEDYVSKNIDYNSLLKSKIVFYGAQKFNTADYDTVFKKIYPDINTLNHNIFNVFLDELADNKSKITITEGIGRIPEELLGVASFKTADFKKVDTFFSQVKEEYLFIIKQLTIHKENSKSAGSIMNSPACRVTIAFECWEVKNQNKIISGYTSGFSDREDINDAIKKAVQNAADYLLQKGDKNQVW